MPWNNDLLLKINTADDLKIAPYHSDMRTTGTPTWIWEVAVDDRLFVRAYSGTASRWYQAAITQKTGRIHALDRVFEVRFAKVSNEALNQRIDESYRQKYAKSRYVMAMISEGAREATVEILP